MTTPWMITRDGKELYEDGECFNSESLRFYLEGFNLGSSTKLSKVKPSEIVTAITQLSFKMDSFELSILTAVVTQFYEDLMAKELDQANSADLRSAFNELIDRFASTFDLELELTAVSLLQDYVYIYSKDVIDYLSDDSQELVSFNELADRNPLPTDGELMLMIPIFMEYLDFERLMEECPNLSSTSKMDYLLLLLSKIRKQQMEDEQ